MCGAALCSGSKLESTHDGAPFRCCAWARPAGAADVEKSSLLETDQPCRGRTSSQLGTAVKHWF